MSVKMRHQNDRTFVQSAMELLRLCASSWLIRLTSTDRHPPGIVTVTNTCVWCRNIYRDRRATYLHHQQSWKRGYCTGRGCHLHTEVIPVNTTCSHCDEHFESVAMLLEHLRTEFPLDQRNAELGLDAGSGNAGGEATETEAPSRRTGAAEPRHTEADAANSFRSALKHDLEIRELQAATFRAMRVKYDEPLVQASKAATGRFVTKSKEGQRPTGEPHVYGWAAINGCFDHGPSTLLRRRAESGGIHVQREFTGDSPAERLLEPVQKNISEGLGQVAVFRGLPDSTHLGPHHQSHESEGCQREVRPTSSRGNVRELQHMLNYL